MSESLLVVAGEVSGDMHAAALLHELQRMRPGLRAWGIGGPGLRAAGMETRRDVSEMAVMGLWEVLQRLPFFRRVFRETLDEALRTPPSAALLVDYPGFNLRLAAALKRRGIPVIYYICPQVWAWHRSRVRRIARIVDHLLVLFPFEVDVFAGTGLPVTFVGHPLADGAAAEARSDPPDPGWSGSPRVALLPGSRRQEIVQILPPMLEAARLLSERHPGAGFLLAAPTPEAAAHAESVFDRTGRFERVRTVIGRTRAILRTADAAWVASGTATLEAAVQGCPMIVVYRTAALTYLAARAVIRIPHIGLVNIVAEREICPERIQYEARAEALVEAIEPLLRDGPERQHMCAGLAEVVRRLGGGRAACRAAEEVHRFMGPATDRSADGLMHRKP